MLLVASPLVATLKRSQQKKETATPSTSAIGKLRIASGNKNSIKGAWGRHFPLGTGLYYLCFVQPFLLVLR